MTFKKLTNKQLLKKIETAEWNQVHHPVVEGRKGWAEIEKLARKELKGWAEIEKLARKELSTRKENK